MPKFDFYRENDGAAILVTGYLVTGYLVTGYFATRYFVTENLITGKFDHPVYFITLSISSPFPFNHPVHYTAMKIDHHVSKTTQTISVGLGIF